MSSKLPLLVLITLLGGLGIIWLQNSQPLSLVLFNQALPLALPLGIWLIAAVLLGLLLSLILQLLLRGGNPSVKGDRPNPRLERLKQRPSREPDRRTGRSDWERSRANYDWTDKELEAQDEESWDIESPPSQPTRPKAPQPANSAEPEIRPQPKPQRPRPTPPVTPAPSPTPSPAPKQQPKAADSEAVYDADYRILTPPYDPDATDPGGVDPNEDEEWI
ncbi:hypothetical protein [Picosynechococcus sp. NKBG15041c]|uniref:hypothetical protein n=1 Tax=Picosynechococcus sp. NKBG15041c TaxID=1407650 RepID=UPI000413A818|nr:hypothetical protein [Picosynechococcus sp. NKBG15041c]